MTRSWRWLSVGPAAALAAAGLGAAIVSAPIAEAAGSTALVAPAGVTPSLVPASAVPSTTKIYSSEAVAGYHVIDATGVTSLNGTVKVPTYSCPATGTYSDDLTVQVVGLSNTSGISGGSFIRFSCKTGVSNYSAFIGWAGFVGGTRAFAVSPGNTVQTQVTIRQTKKSTIALAVVTNESTGTVTKKTVDVKTRFLSATSGWDAFQHVGGTPVPPFTSASWTGATVNGSSFSSAAAERYNMIDTTKHVVVSTSALSATGSAFSNKFKAST